MKSSLPFLFLAVGLGACGDNGGNSPAPDGGPDAPGPAGPRITFFDYPMAIDVSPDGSTALFQRFEGIDAEAVFVDVASGQSTVGPVIGDASKAMASGIADGGRISAQHGVPTLASVWDEAIGWTDFGSPYAGGCDQDIAGAFDLSGDGHAVVGLVWDVCAPRAFVWNDADGTGEYTILDLLGTPFEGGPNPPSNRGSVISDDGAVIGGFAQVGGVDRKPAMWKASDGTGVVLEDVSDIPGEILSINGDGTVLAGVYGDDGFIWTEAAGMVTLPRPSIALPTDRMFPNAMTADGTRIFGGVGDAFFSVPNAFAWSEADGAQALGDLVDLDEGWALNSVLGASADGTVLIGTATDPDFALKTFILQM